MGLITCFACGRQRNIKPVPRQTLTCSNCGARDPRKTFRIKVWMNVEERDGVERSIARRRTMAWLKSWGESKGYKAGWAAVKFKTIFLCWPDAEQYVPPEPPDAELLHWVKRNNAAYARERRKEEAAAQTKLALAVAPATSSLMSDADWDVRL